MANARNRNPELKIFKAMPSADKTVGEPGEFVCALCGYSCVATQAVEHFKSHYRGLL